MTTTQRDVNRALDMMYHGHSIHETARAVGKNPGTVAYWRACAKRAGVKFPVTVGNGSIKTLVQLWATTNNGGSK